MSVKILVSVYLLISSVHGELYAAEVGRSPASYAPDTEVAVLPPELPKGYIEQIHENNREVIEQNKHQLQQWAQNEETLKMYGVKQSQLYPTVSADYRKEFVERNYLRFMHKKIERQTNQDFNKGLKGWVDSWNSSDEVDSIINIEQRAVKVEAKAEEKGQKIIQKKKEIRVSKTEKIKFRFLPRLEMGMVKIELKSSYLNVRAWLGVASGNEIKVDKTFKLTNTKAFANYYIDENRVLANLEQPLLKGLRLRYTYDKVAPKDAEITGRSIASEQSSIQLRYGMGF